MHDGIGGRRGGGMSGGDLVARWTRYLNEFMAEWAVPEDLVYALGSPARSRSQSSIPLTRGSTRAGCGSTAILPRRSGAGSGWLSRTTMPGAATRYNARNAAPPGGKAARWQTTTANAFGSMTTG